HPEHTTPPKQTLGDLSRNASVMSSSNTDSEEELAPPRPRPMRTFSAPRSPQSPTTRGASGLPPSDLSHKLVYTEPSPPPPPASNGKPNSKSLGKPSLQDFQFGVILGEGSYSTVKLGTSRIDGKQYAIKVISRSHLIRKHKAKTATAERNALIRLRGHPGIVSLYYAFYNEWNIYFVMDLAANGEMQSLISRLGSLSTRCVQYYAAQIADAMEYMHSKDVIHRDLKPENLLLDDAFRIKITDFGTGKVLENGELAETTARSALWALHQGFDGIDSRCSSDYWAFGCVVYQIIAGRFAFNDRSDYLTWQKVKKVEYEFPSGFDEQAKDLVQRLLVSAMSLGFLASPTFEPGLVKKEQPLAQGQDRNWEDVWDELVGNDDIDGIEWSSDAEDPRRHSGQESSTPNPHTTEIGPKDEIKLLAFQDAGSARSLPSDLSRDDSSSSLQSSSGNVVDRLRDSIERLEIRSSGRTSETT
ncbi:kinase-like domain-containing protein, partial [Mycena latifolia]